MGPWEEKKALDQDFLFKKILQKKKKKEGGGLYHLSSSLASEKLY